MKLLTAALAKRLLANGQATREAQAQQQEEPDHMPVVKFFDPCGASTWLITECDPEEPGQLFGLCDLGMGYPELGYVSLRELQIVRGKMGLRMERDQYFTARKTLSEYANDARETGRIQA